MMKDMSAVREIRVIEAYERVQIVISYADISGVVRRYAG